MVVRIVDEIARLARVGDPIVELALPLRPGDEVERRRLDRGDALDQLGPIVLELRLGSVEPAQPRLERLRLVYVVAALGEGGAMQVARPAVDLLEKAACEMRVRGGRACEVEHRRHDVEQLDDLARYRAACAAGNSCDQRYVR